MKEVLMNPDAPGPDVHYYMINGGSIKTNITVWEPGTVGGEYIKAYGHYNIGDSEEVYHVLQGSGIVIFQEREVDENGAFIDDEIKSFRAVSVKAGDKFYIPENTAHLAVNTGKTWLVTTNDAPMNFEEDIPNPPEYSDYEPFRKLRGAAYYIVEKDGKSELVLNSNYTKVPKAKIE